jgi:DNA repair exonuclease SbcCD ATPase subunit
MASQMDSLSFVKEGSTKRKEILAKFLDLDLFDAKFKLAKKDLSEKKSVIKHLRSMNWDLEIGKKQDVLDDIEIDIREKNERCKEIDIELKTMVAQLEEINEAIDAIPAEIIDISSINRRILQKENHTTSLMTKNASLSSKISTNKQTLQEVIAFVDTFDLNVLLEEKQRHSELIDSKSSNSSDIRDLSTTISNSNKKMKLLDNHEYDPDCKYCINNKFVKDAKKAEAGLKDLKERMSNLKMHAENIESKLSELNIEDIEEKIASYHEVVSRRDSLQTEIERDGLQIESNNKQIQINNTALDGLIASRDLYEENREAIENKEAFLAKRDEYSRARSKLTGEQRDCEEALQEFFIEKGSTQQAITSYQERKQELEAIEKEFVALDLFLQCMHPNGIAYNVIRQMLPVINEEIAKVLTSIVDFEVFFVDNGKSLDIMLKHPKYDARPMSMGSGAEKTLSAMAIRLALISITNLPKSELFILDEPATALDQEHMDGFVKMLEMIKSQFKTVLLISHLDSLKDCADLTIDIQKKKGYARVNL